MFPEPSDRNELSRYMALGQVGLEMAAPIGLGLVLDHYLNWSPWGAVGGAVLGLVGGFVHLLRLLNQDEPRQPPGTGQDSR